MSEKAISERDAGTCVANVSSSSGWGHVHACGKRGKVERDGKWYCGTHDPEARKAKDAERHAIRLLEDEVRRAKWAVSDAEKVLVAVAMHDRDDMTLGTARDLLRQAREKLTKAERAKLPTPPEKAAVWGSQEHDTK